MYRDSRFYSNGGDNDFRANDEGYEGTPSYRPQRVEVPTEYKTFDQWKVEGKWVKKGSKSKKFGRMSYFHVSQVR